MKESTLIKYISGQATYEEKKEVLDWIEESQENRQKYNRLKNLWVISSMPQQKSSAQEAREFVQHLQHKKRVLPFISYSIAASMLLLVAFMAWTKINTPKAEESFIASPQITQHSFYTNKGVKGQVTLPDGSVIWLNSDSKVNYPSTFSGDYRKIIFSGEGFFNIVPNPEKPMIIQLEHNLQIEVKGTTFNLSSYKNDDKISALLLSGNISVKRTHNNKQEEITIQPNERIEIQKTKERTATINIPATTFPIIGWKEGWLIFNETPIADVLKKLERWHGISFKVEDPDLLKQKFTAKFHEESISQILDMMTNIALLRYEIQNNTAILYKY